MSAMFNDKINQSQYVICGSENGDLHFVKLSCLYRDNTDIPESTNIP